MNFYFFLSFHICPFVHSAVINKRITGGAMQLSFSSITLDYYPFHKAGTDPTRQARVS